MSVFLSVFFIECQLVPHDQGIRLIPTTGKHRQCGARAGGKLVRPQPGEQHVREAAGQGDGP